MSRKEEARDLWTKLSACLEATVGLDEIRPVLQDIKEFFGPATPLGRFVNEVLLKEEEADWIEMDSIRHILHEEWDDSIEKTDLRKSIELKYR